MSIVFNSIVAVVSAGIGAVVGPYILQGPDRRAARAAVREAIHRARWAWHPVDVIGQFEYGAAHPRIESTIAEIESLSMIAGISRRHVDRYAAALRAAADNPGREGPVGEWILCDDMRLELQEATRLMIFSVWHPWAHVFDHAVTGLPDQSSGSHEFLVAGWGSRPIP